MIDLLRKNIQQFVDITDEDYLGVRSLFEHKQFNKGDFIIRGNEQVPFMYFILSGLVKLSYWDQEAEEHIVSFAMEDWWETDFTAFYNGTKSTFTLQCIKPTTVYCISLDNYKKLCLSFPYMTGYFLDKSIKGHLANQRRIISLLTLNPKEKYEQFLQLYPSLVQRIPKTILAPYLGVSRETLSRLYRSRKTKL